jgi:hypothetical protein
MMGAVVGLSLPEKHREEMRSTVFLSGSHDLGDGGEIPYIEGMERGF